MTAVTAPKSRVPPWLPWSVVIGTIVGMLFGLFIRAGQGYDCGPLPGLQSALGTFALIGLGAILLLIALVAAVFRRLGVAAALGLFTISAAAGAAIGIFIGVPVDRCPRPTSEVQHAMLTLRLDEPYSFSVSGPGICIRDIASQRVLAVRIEDEGPQPRRWLIQGVEIFEIAMGYGPTEPGLQIGLSDPTTHASALYRQAADSQVAQTTAADGRSGTYTFVELPREAGASLALPGAPTELSGFLDWECPEGSLGVPSA